MIINVVFLHFTIKSSIKATHPLPPSLQRSMPEDLDGSGDDGEGSGSGDLSEENSGE